MIRDPFVVYRQPKIRRLLSQLVMLAICITILYSFAELVFVYNFAFMTWMGSPSFTTLLVVVILGWLGYLIINGKFQPQVDYQGQGQPQRQPQRQPQPIKPKVVRPIQIEIEECAFCGKEHPVHDLTEFKDNKGNIIYVCEKCME